MLTTNKPIAAYYSSKHEISPIKALFSYDNAESMLREYMTEEISRMQAFRKQLKKQYPGLLSNVK